MTDPSTSIMSYDDDLLLLIAMHLSTEGPFQRIKNDFASTPFVLCDA